MYAYQLRRWFDWCDTNGLDPLGGIQRAHVELYIRHLGDRSYAVFHQHDHARRPWVLPVRAHRRPDPADPAVYARLPRVHHDESRTQGLDRLELIRFLQVAQAITVHHGALDAQETVASLLADASSLPPAPERDPEALDQLLTEHGAWVVAWQGWCAIKIAEGELDRTQGRERAKIVDRQALLTAAAGGGLA